MVVVVHCKTEQAYIKGMNSVCYQETLHYRKADALIRLTSLHDWRKYKITPAPRDPHCTIIRVGEGDQLIIYLREVGPGWDVEFRHTLSTISGNTQYTTVKKGRTPYKRDAATTFLWSVLSNLSSRDVREFNEREHNIFAKIYRYFNLHRCELAPLIGDWKANAKG